MRLMGPSVLSWRLAEVGVTATCVMVMYLLGKELFGRGAGVIAAVLLGSSHYLMAFNRIAYNNTHALLYASIAVLLLVLAWKSQRAALAYATGIAAGMCLYTFQESLFTWPILALAVLAAFLSRPIMKALPVTLTLLGGFALTVIPALIMTPPWAMAKVAIEQSSKGMPLIERAQVFIGNIVRTPVTFWVNDQWRGAYVAGPIVDTITGLGLLLGLAIALFSLHGRAQRLLIIWLGLGLVLLALTAHSQAPSITRMLYLLPPIFLLASLGIWTVGRTIMKSLNLPRPVVITGLATLMCAVYGLNVYQLVVVSPAELSQTRATLVVRALQEHPTWRVVHVLGSNSPDEILKDVVDRYPWMADRYSQATLSVPLPEIVAGSENMTLVYLLTDGDQDARARAMSRKKDNEGLVTLRDPVNSTRIWLLVPEGTPF
jgi:hypothetical protein